MLLLPPKNEPPSTQCTRDTPAKSQGPQGPQKFRTDPENPISTPRAKLRQKYRA